MENGADLLVDGLVRWGVRHLFGMPGSHSTAIYDAIAGRHDRHDVDSQRASRRVRRRWLCTRDRTNPGSSARPPARARPTH